jgi:AcrR family transcriptional regulator
MFLKSSFEYVTVEQVAEAAEVSARTVYRYFSTKEQLALAMLSDLDNRFLEAVKSRPRKELPIETLRFALRSAWEWLEADEARAHNYLALQGMVDTNASLRAANLHRAFDQQQLLVDALGCHKAFDGRGEMYPKLVVAAFSSASALAVEQWRLSTSDITELKSVLDRTVEALVPALRLAGDVDG